MQIGSLEKIQENYNHKTHELDHALRGVLRRFPYWSGGHLRLAELALESNDIATAYASAQAILQLKIDLSASLRARRVLGQCYLRRGALESAVETLEALRRDAPHDIVAAEELAAAYMAQGKEDAAGRLLEGLPEAKMTAAGLMARQYHRRRSGTPDQ